MKCFYHNRDLDGIFSGALVMQHVRVDLMGGDMIGVDYGDKLDRRQIVPGEHVYVVDFSFPPEDMEWLMKNATLVWIDHHKTAIDDSKGRSYGTSSGLRMVGVAACALAWEYFSHDKHPQDNMPIGIRLLSDYDVWNNSDERYWRDDVMPFQYGARAKSFTVENFPVGAMSSRDYVHLVKLQGTGILEYQKGVDEKAMDFGAFPATLNVPNGTTLKVIACNNMARNSQTFASVWDAERYEAMCVFGLNKSGKWVFSLYTDRDDIDVSVIAKAFGGGGHRQAAGFMLNDWKTAFKS